MEGFCKNCKKPTRSCGLNGYANYCDMKCSNSHIEVKNKKIITCTKNYGVSNPGQSKIIQERMGNTCFKNLGVRIPFQSQKIKNKIKFSLINSVGVDNPMKYKKYKEKMCKSTFNHFGVNWSFQSPIVREKTKLVLLKKYGVDNIAKTLKEREKRRKIASEWLGVYACSKVSNPSKPQLVLFEMVKEIFPEAEIEYWIENVRRKIDIVIKEIMIAIEYDGSYWHQDKEADYNRQKSLEEFGWKFLRYVDKIPSKDELVKDIQNLI
jgi:hypothetical protein